MCVFSRVRNFTSSLYRYAARPQEHAHRRQLDDRPDCHRRSWYYLIPLRHRQTSYDDAVWTQGRWVSLMFVGSRSYSDGFQVWRNYAIYARTHGHYASPPMSPFSQLTSCTRAQSTAGRRSSRTRDQKPSSRVPGPTWSEAWVAPLCWCCTTSSRSSHNKLSHLSVPEETLRFV